MSNSLAVVAFPSASLSSSFVSIGSNRTGETDGYDIVLRGALVELPRDSDGASTTVCNFPTSTVQAWLLALFRPLGAGTELGDVPVQVYGLRSQCYQTCIQWSRVAISKIEFVVHRYGDAYGVHYSCLISALMPHELYAFKTIGVVSSDMLWSVANGP